MTGEKEVVKAESGAGNFGECLVEGSPEDRKRGKKMKRRAIVMSIAFESLGLTALLIAPLLAKPAELAVQNAMPIPPYRHYLEQRHARERRLVRPEARFTTLFQPNSIPHHVSTVDRNVPPERPGFDELPVGTNTTQTPDELFPLVDPRNQVVAPPPSPETKRVILGHIDAALLTHRVEPAYPQLARQIHRSGKVELHALIAIDGSIQSLQLVSGDPMFVQSAMDAVRQWRYKPTLLNGQPVEIDTFITVIYTLNQQ
jgi:periplasmic protein TonB